jgi:succinylglutamate desuccinylase
MHVNAPAPASPSVRLSEFDGLPAGVLEAPAAALHEILPGPTLIHLPGRRSPPLFVSALLHGNEDVGLVALQQLLRRHGDGRALPRALSLFIGNVAAAEAGVRRLDGQPDYNRTWPGTPDPRTPEAALMRAVFDAMAARSVFASIDLHNNTGLNPHYACVTRLDTPFLQLASLFGRTVVYFRTPPGTQTGAFAALAPSVTCECGKTGDAAGAARAAEFVDACLHLEAVPDQPVRPGDVHLFHTIATLRVPESASMSFDGTPADLRFVPDLDQFNFRELLAGAALAEAAPSARLLAFDEQGDDRSEELLARSGDRVVLARALMPSMLTRDERVVRQDFLGYLMERLG